MNIQPKMQSPTSVITYLSCPRKYYDTYILKLPQVPSIHMVKGNIIHKTFELFYKAYNVDLTAHMEKCFKASFDKHLDKVKELGLTAEELGNAVIDCKRMIDLNLFIFKSIIEDLIFVKKVQNERHAFYTIRPKFRELWIEDKELNLCGYIDRVHKGFDGKTTIGDYKTGSMYGIGLKDDHEVQTSIYALLYKRKTDIVPDYSSIIFLRYGGYEVATPVTPERIKHALETVQMVHDKTKSKDIKDYPKKEQKLCKWCQSFDRCSGIEKAEDKIRQDKVLEQMKKASVTPDKKK